MDLKGNQSIQIWSDGYLLHLETFLELGTILMLFLFADSLPGNIL